MLVIDVNGMTCSGCASAVERVVKAQDRAATVRVDLTFGRVVVETREPAQKFVDAIQKAGYGASVAA